MFKKLAIAVTDVPVPSDPIWKTCSSFLEKDGLIFSPQSLYVRAMKKTEVENIKICLCRQDCVKIINVKEQKANSGWTDIMHEILVSNIETKCVWQFKRHRIAPGKSCLFSFEANCPTFQSKINGSSEAVVGEHGLYFNVITNLEVSPCKHNYKKRPLAGPRRFELGKKSF